MPVDIGLNPSKGIKFGGYVGTWLTLMVKTDFLYYFTPKVLAQGSGTL